MDYFKFLPVEITSHMLTRFPTKSVLHCKSVSKTWRNPIGYPSFSKRHFNHHNQADNDSGELSFFALTYKIEHVSGKYTLGIPRYHYFVEYNEKDESTPIERNRRIHSTAPFNCFVGLLNGLIYLVGNPTEEKPHEPIYIFNPIIKEYVMLPEINTDYHSYNSDVLWMNGFGYVSATNEYKVVRIYKLKNKFVEVSVYTLGGGNGWRNLGKFDPSFIPFPWGQGVFANGYLHWMGVELDMIATFNSAEEKFCQHISPPPSSPDDWPFNRIGVLDRFWFFANFLTTEEDSYYDIQED
ncbi:F-box/kelch-repeat protein At3g06240-like [Papaver somniferum]|uniref:F-box/kelch-repeat protein At3g06240-like n=1 Tax=Papaver somniferum TaxID=3469 RepID=UPI000E6FC279|nr:F-box/kelch-repeat protein At3g06240-like [Papaver somniferum]